MTQKTYLKTDEGFTFVAEELIRVLMQLGAVKMFDLIAAEYSELHTDEEDRYDLISKMCQNLAREIDELESSC